MINILIIGSDSFIAQKFLENSYCNIKGISRTVTKSSSEIVVSDLFDLQENVYEGFDVVLNFAAIVHRPEIKDAGLYNEINHKLTVLNARKAKCAGVKLFIQMSTVAVYGNSSKISIQTPYNPQDFYGSSKLNADKDLLAMQDDNFKVAIVRPPMVYGGGKAPGNMMRLIKLVDKGIPLPFKGINNKRDFVNVNNLIQYLEIIAIKQLNGIFLISDHQPVSTEFLVKAISHHLDKKIYIIKVPKIVLKVFKKWKSREYEKLYGFFQIETNFPFENLIKRFSLDDGIKEMIEIYITEKQFNKGSC